MPGTVEYPSVCVATATTTYVIHMGPVPRKRPPKIFKNVAIACPSFARSYPMAFKNIHKATTARLP